MKQRARLYSLCFAVVVLFSVLCNSSSFVALAQDAPAYRDPKRPVEERVTDLVGRMTLHEKIKGEHITDWA